MAFRANSVFLHKVVKLFRNWRGVSYEEIIRKCFHMREGRDVERESRFDSSLPSICDDCLVGRRFRRCEWRRRIFVDEPQGCK